MSEDLFDVEAVHWSRPIEFRVPLDGKLGREIPARKTGVRIWRPALPYWLLTGLLGKPTTTANEDGSYTHTFKPDYVPVTFNQEVLCPTTKSAERTASAQPTRRHRSSRTS